METVKYNQLCPLVATYLELPLRTTSFIAAGGAIVSESVKVQIRQPQL